MANLLDRIQLLLAPVAFLLVVLFDFEASAASLASQVQPNQVVLQGLQFNVQRRFDRASNQSEFIVEILAKSASLSAKTAAWISLVHVDRNSFSSQDGRRIDCTSEAARLRCQFTVSSSKLANRELSFVLEEPDQTSIEGRTIAMPAMNLLYFRLQDPKIEAVETPDQSFLEVCLEKIRAALPILRIEY